MTDVGGPQTSHRETPDEIKATQSEGQGRVPVHEL